MKKILVYLVAGSLVLNGTVAKAVLITGVAAVVNDAVITLGEIESKVYEASSAVQARYAHDEAGFEREVSKLRDETFEQRIEDKLILHEFVSSGYVTNVLEAFIDDRIQEYIQKVDYGDRARLIRTLREQGKTYEMFRREQREKFIIDYMDFQNRSSLRKIIISPLKIEQYYEAHKDEFELQDQVKLRMITLAEPPGSPEGTAKRLGEEILAKIDAGVPFAEMASVYSTGSQRLEGGDRGWVDRKYFKPELADIAFSLKPGQHSGVIVQPESCYLMMVEDVKLAHVKPLSEVKGDIEQTITAQESIRLRKQWIDRLKRKSFVRFYDFAPMPH